MKFGCSLSGGPADTYEDLRRAAQAFDDAGFDYVTTNGHILSAPPGRYPDRPTSAYAGAFRDPFVLFSHVAAITTRVRLRTAIVILPLFPTALIAKHAAELALASDGRFDLGVGISWQRAEYDAMGKDHSVRGRMFEEQLAVLRLLWSAPHANFSGEFHLFDDIGIGQVPPHPIPIWIGCGDDDALLARVARYADGWIPVGGLASADPVERLARHARSNAKGPLAIAGRAVASADRTAMIDAAIRQRALGATELTIAPAPDVPEGARVDALVRARSILAEELG